MDVTPVKILLVDDHELVRAGFRTLLNADGEYEILETDNAEQAYEMFVIHNPLITIIDLQMPGASGLEGIRRIRRRDQSAKIVVLSMYDDPSYIKFARDEGVMGYVTKRSAPVELSKAIHEIRHGREYYSKDLDIHTPDNDSESALIETLSRREFEIMTLLARGDTIIQIAENLHISPKTASNHRDNIMRKLKMKNIVSLVHYAIRHGIINP